MKITLKDGSVKEYAQAMAIIDIAKDISEGLARMACVAEVNGEVVDLRTVVDADCELNILTAKDPAGLAALRHTASHVMAQAVQRIWPTAKLAIGPSIADGFYYDIDFAEPISADFEGRRQPLSFPLIHHSHPHHSHCHSAWRDSIPSTSWHTASARPLFLPLLQGACKCRNETEEICPPPILF